MKKNTDYITLLSVISAIAVVFLHAQFAFFAFSTDRYWFTATIIRGIFYFAVPVFFMITGATLIDYKDRYSTKDFFYKRIKKVVIPFLIWSIIALLYRLFYTKSINFSSLNFQSIFNGIMESKYQNVYWYFPVCISVYLCIPLFASIQKDKRKNIFTYLVIAAFVLNILLPFINNILKLKLTLPIKISVASDYLLFVLAGYLLSHYELNKKKRIGIYLLGLVGLLMETFGTYFLSIHQNTIVYTFSGYCNVPCVLYSISIFVFIRYFGAKVMNCSVINKLIKCLGKYTFAIYLIHMFVRESLVKQFNLNTITIIYRLFSPFLVIGICIIITIILRKIKYIKEIVPE